MNKYNCWIPLEYKYNPKTKRVEPTGYLPSDKQEVIVSDGRHTWVDTFINNGEVCCFDRNMYMYGKIKKWMPLIESWEL